jgi:hypothetical protein
LIEQHQLVMTHSHVTSLLLTPDKANVIRNVNESCHRAPARPDGCASLATGERVLMDTTPAEAHARAHAAIYKLGDDIELRRLRVHESGGHYFADGVVAVPPGQPVVAGGGHN